tara:strand:- start:1 stop:1014 length:1014 start_codon:yes stop_codon:yes gene_type:complete
MTTYKEINGTNIEAVASDPSNPVDGQVWYNTTSNTVKGQRYLAAAWATGGNLNTARAYLAGMGTQTAALVTGGWAGSPTADPSGDGLTESYNGSAWTEVGDLNTNRSQVGGAGVQTSAVVFGGNSGTTPSATRNAVANNESWNGSAWTEVGDLNTARRVMGNSGVSNTSVLAFVGDTSPGLVTLTELWNGTNWTEVNDANTARSNVGSNGTQTSALLYGGYGPARSAQTESWNGTNWTEVADLGGARYGLRGAGENNTSAVAFGGESAPAGGYQVVTEVWNGSAWTEVADLNTARTILSGNGTGSSALASGGFTGTVTVSTEEFTGGNPATVTFDNS